MEPINYEERYDLLCRFLVWKHMGVQSALRTAKELVLIDDGEHGSFWYLPGNTPDDILADIKKCVERWGFVIKRVWEGDDAPDENNDTFVLLCIRKEEEECLHHRDLFDWMDDEDWAETWLDYKTWRAKAK